MCSSDLTVAMLLVALALPALLMRSLTLEHSRDPAFAALPDGCRLFSDDVSAKYIELYRPDVRVWIDGRQDYWGRERLLQWRNYSQARGDSPLVPMGTTCVLLVDPGSAPLAELLDKSPSWTSLSRTTRYAAWQLTA